MSEQAATFRALHDGAELLLLPNAWDPGSARLVESLGAKAIATTSAGMAWAAGYTDGNNMPVDVVASTAAGILRLIKVPLTVDIEAGYSLDPRAVGELAERLADLGVVGLNIEDGVEPPELLARKIEGVKTALSKRGLEMFVNARTDVYLAGLASGSQAVEEVLRRVKLYGHAGADGLFVPAITSIAEIAQVTSGTALPVNVLAWEGLPAPDRLHAAGVRRLSAGSAIAARVWAHAWSLAGQFLRGGELAGAQMPFKDLQSLYD